MSGTPIFFIAVAFSSQNQAGSGTRSTLVLKNLVLLVTLVLASLRSILIIIVENSKERDCLLR